MIEPKEIPVGTCIIRLWRLGHHLQTVFADGLYVDAAPNYDPDSIQRSRDVGYASTWEMSRDHEILHTLVDVARGYPYSRVLRGVAVRKAGGDKESIISSQESAAEEALVLDLQKYIMRGGISARLLLELGEYLDTLKSKLREITDA